MRGDENNPLSRNFRSWITCRAPGVFFAQEWMSVILLSALTLLWASAVALGASDAAGGADGHKWEGSFPASRLIGMAVKDEQDHVIAEIHDFVMNEEGTVKQAILSVGGVAGIGDKLVAVAFDDLLLEEQWNKRPIRTRAGQKVEVAWEKQLKAVYREARSLRDLPAYTYEDDLLRGGSTGWGVYSAPAGPSLPQEVTGGRAQQ
jgi:hypothetical protein